MYAVIKTGGKQYTVREGDVLKVEKMELGDAESVEFAVLMLGTEDSVQVGTPFVEGAKVTATIENQGRLPKVGIVKFHRRKHHRKQMGHRQYFTEVKITGIHAA